jgi:hypothetical protein
MKKIHFLFVFLAFTLLLACSSDDSNSGSSGNFSTPITIGNYWTYDVEGQTGTTRDSLYISNDTVIESNTYKKFKTKNNFATGFYSSTLRNNGVRVSNGKLLLSGDLSLAGGQTLPIAVDLTLNDFIIFDKDASNNQALNSSPKSGTINETFNGYPLTINYSLQAYGGETLANFTSDGTVYTNVKSTKIKLNVSVTTSLSGIQIPVLANQEILVSTQYLADGIGVVYTNTVISYNLNPTAADFLGITPSNTQSQEEFLDTYLVN